MIIPKLIKRKKLLGVNNSAVVSRVNATPTATQIELSYLTYIGGFTFPDAGYGDGGPSFSTGRIALNPANSSLFMTGNPKDPIGEYTIPALVNTTNINAMNQTAVPLQNYKLVLPPRPTPEHPEYLADNPDDVDTVTGMAIINGELVINAVPFYDAASPSAETTTIVYENPNSIATSSRRIWLNMPDGAKSAGWMSQVPAEWQAAVGSDWIMGNSSNLPIFSRHSIGPSAYALDTTSLANATSGSPTVSATKMMMFPHITGQLHNDDYGVDPANDLWNILTGAWYGFIIPGTSTYAAFGSMGGSQSGIGYKITRSDGQKCAGYCTNVIEDVEAYYWFFEVQDLLDAKNGLRSPSSIRPYNWGIFPLPFVHQNTTTNPTITGGAYDAATGKLYLSVAHARRTTFASIPVIMVFTIGAP